MKKVFKNNFDLFSVRTAYSVFFPRIRSGSFARERKVEIDAENTCPGSGRRTDQKMQVSIRKEEN